MSGLLTCEKHSLMVGTLSHSFVLRIKDEEGRLGQFSRMGK